MVAKQNINCPLCLAKNTSIFINVHQREFLKCSTCQLIFANRANLITTTEELTRYQHHENDPADSHYRRFLLRLINPLLPKLNKHEYGLDFGCGPGPAISVIMSELGYRVSNYDPYFANNYDLLTKQYDFITSTEVFEHLRSPAESINLLNNLLKPGAWLGVMTQFYETNTNFAAWHYPRDPTHINFFSVETMNWIAKKYKWTLESDGQSVALFYKPR